MLKKYFTAILVFLVILNCTVYATVDTIPPSAPSAFTATSLSGKIRLAWTNPTDSDLASVTIRRSSTGYPSSISSDTAIATNISGTSFSDASISNATTYYYSIFAKDTAGNVSARATALVTADTAAPAAPAITASKSSPNGSTILLSWNIPSTTSKFLLTRSYNGGAAATTVSSNISGSQTSYSQTSLAEGTYSYSLYAIDSAINTSNAGVSPTITIDTTAPVAPSLSAAKSALNGNAISLAWNVPASTSKFVLTRSFNGGAASIIDNNISAATTSLSQTALADGTYSYSLYAVDSFTNTSNAGISSTVTIDTTAPVAPSLSAAKSSLNGDSISLAWNVPASTSKFVLTRSFNGGVASVINNNISAATTSLTQSALADGTYAYSLYAVDSFTNTSNAGISSTITIDTTAPAAPTSFSASASGSTISLTWVNPTASDFASVIIRRSTSEFPTSFSLGTLVVSDNIGTSYSDENFSTGTYFYSIFAKDNLGNISLKATAQASVDVTAPAAPTSFSASALGSTISLTWVNPTASDFASVIIRRSTSEFPTSISSGALVVTGNTGTSISDSGLSTGTYYYSIFAKDNLGNVSLKSTAQASVDVTVPASPTHISAIATDNMIVLSWTNPSDSDFSGIMIRRSRSSAPASITEGSLVANELTGTSFTDTNLHDGAYFYALFAYDLLGNYAAPANASATVAIPQFGNSGAISPHLPVVTLEKDTDLSNVQLSLGSESAVTLNLQEKLSSKGGSIGDTKGVAAVVVMNSSSSQWTSSDDLVIGNNGSGTFVQNSGSVEVDGDLVLGKNAGSTGKYVMSGGSLKVDSIASGDGSSSFTWNGGQIEVESVEIDLANDGGILKKPDSISTLVIQGDYSQSADASLNLSVSSENLDRNSLETQSFKTQKLSAHSSSSGVYGMSIRDSFSIDGTLVVTLPSSYIPKVGDRFLVLQAGSISGQFASLSLPALASGFSWDSSDLYTNGTLRIQSLSDSLTVSKPLNYPNPFKSRTGTHIGYRLSKDADIELKVYTLTGHEICKKSYTSGTEGGRSGYNTVSFSSTEAGLDLPTDVYIYLLINNGKIIGRGKMATLP